MNFLFRTRPALYAAAWSFVAVVCGIHTNTFSQSPPTSQVVPANAKSGQQAVLLNDKPPADTPLNVAKPKAPPTEPPKPDYLQGKSNEVDWTEVGRRGDAVSVAGTGIRSAEDVLYNLSLATPEDDSYRWNISVWGPSTDERTQALKRAFETDANLSPFVAQPPAALGGKPWAHFQLFHSDDPMQTWRYQKWDIPSTGPFPVVTIQPPRNNSWGGVTTVRGTDGKDHTVMLIVDRIEADQWKTYADLRRRIQASHRAWIDKLAKQGFIPPEKLVKQYYGPEGTKVANNIKTTPNSLSNVPTNHPQHLIATDDEITPIGSHNGLPPFYLQLAALTLSQTDTGAGAAPWIKDPPKNPPLQPQWPANGPATDPPSTPGFSMDLTSIFVILTLVLTAGSNVWMLYRELRKKEGAALLLTDQQFAYVLSLLKAFGINPQPQPQPTPQPTPLVNPFSPFVPSAPVQPLAPTTILKQNPDGTFSPVTLSPASSNAASTTG